MNANGNQLLPTPNIRQPDAKLAALLDAMPDAIVLCDSQKQIVLANEMAGALFGYPKGDLPGKQIAMLLPSEPVDSAREAFGLRQDGSEFPVEVICKPFGEAWNLCVIRDLTERKNFQKELKRKIAALETARQEFHAFSHSISHDLRAPLRAMDGFAAMLKRALGENLSKESDHAITRIQENASRMTKLIDGLLDYSTLSWVALTPKKVAPRSIAQKSFEGYALSLNQRHVDFSTGELPECEADLALLRRLFDNLISNALKFTRTRDPAVIRVGCRSENGERVYFVQDNGVGFNMEYSGKLFQVFQHLHSPSEFEGTGMGLAIVQRIAQRHGGRAWAEGEVDRGATFYFTLGDSGHGYSA
jgi:signal transduction histidine kinase